MVILDTDHMSLLERSVSPTGNRLRARLDEAKASPPTVTVISYEEQARGWLAYIAAKRTLVEQVTGYSRLLDQLQNYCTARVLPFDEVAAAKWQELRKQKLRVATMDLKIAAIALVHNATLLSRNLRDFGLVPGLQVEDWTK